MEEHHQVLEIWASERKRLGAPFDVLTLDHHTDVLSSDGKSCSELRHDEHIDYALKHGIIAGSVIFSHVNYAENYHSGITIVSFHNYPEFPDAINRETLADYYGNVLESAYLKRCLAVKRPASPYILDIDLDYFITARSVLPSDPAEFLELAAHAECLTVSRETDWVKILNRDWEQKDSAYFLNELRMLISGHKSFDGKLV